MFIEIDYSRDARLSQLALNTLTERYLTPDESSPQEAFGRAAIAFASDSDHAQRIYDYVSKGWAMYSSPVLANGGTNRGLPISCYLSYVPDSLDGLTSSWVENVFLTTGGGGVGNYFGHVRSDGEGTSRGTKSTGVIGFIKTVETQMLAYSQGVNRRGAAAVYMDVSHPEIQEFITIRKPGGDANRKCLARTVFHNAVCIPDAFMDAVDNGDEWNLIDPHSKSITGTVDARELWIKILETRMETGEPYLMFVDTANRSLHPALKAKGLKIYQSNLCNEIYLPTNEDRTAVCCLSSVNLEKWDEWKDDPNFIEDWIRFLDNVIQKFLEAIEWGDQYRKAYHSAFYSRDLGLGAMGFHSYLQSKNIPFESALATSTNKKMFDHIMDQALRATQYLAESRGECPDMKGQGRRNSHVMAIAPNATSGIIAGVSNGIEPESSNIYTRKTDSGSFTIKNPYLEATLESLGKNTKEVWDSIKMHEGSVQHLEFLNDWTKDVFKTAFELDQRWIIDHAGDRQVFIDQGQSVNLFLPSGIGKRELHDIHYRAWKRGLKGLYYVRSTAATRAKVGTVVEREQIVENTGEISSTGDDLGCLGCQ